MIGGGPHGGEGPVIRRERRVNSEVRIGRSDALDCERVRIHPKQMRRRFLKRGEINAIRAPIDNVAVFVKLARENSKCSASGRHDCNMRIGIEEKWIAIRSD